MVEREPFQRKGGYHRRLDVGTGSELPSIFSTATRAQVMAQQRDVLLVEELEKRLVNGLGRELHGGRKVALETGCRTGAISVPACLKIAKLKFPVADAPSPLSI